MLDGTRGNGFGLRGLVWTLRIKSFQRSVALDQAIQKSPHIQVLGGLQAMARQSHGWPDDLWLAVVLPQLGFWTRRPLVVSSKQLFHDSLILIASDFSEVALPKSTFFLTSLRACWNLECGRRNKMACFFLLTYAMAYHGLVFIA